MARATLLSPQRYLRSGYGLALPESYSLSSLRTALIRAQNEVTRYCNVPKLPQPFDWRGGTMTAEQHQWRLTNALAYGPGVKRVYLNAGPLKTVTSFIIDLGRTYQVTFNPTTDLYLNHLEQYLEIVAIAPTIVGVWPLGVALGLYHPVSRTTYTYGWTFPTTEDVLEAESPTVYSGAYGNWDPTVPAEVFLDGTPVDPSDFTVDYDNGQVTFATAPAPRVEVTATYASTVPSEVVDAIGLTATAIIGEARMAERGMVGLSSIKVAEVSLTSMTPMSIRNGASIPSEAAAMVDGYVFGSAYS